jgi:hypothetical protein
VTLGLGMFVGAYVSGKVVSAYAIEGGGHDWAAIWRIPAIGALVIFVIFAVLFKPGVSSRAEAA